MVLSMDVTADLDGSVEFKQWHLLKEYRSSLETKAAYLILL